MKPSRASAIAGASSSLPRHPAVVGPRHVQPRDGAGDAHRERAVVVELVAVPAVLQEHRRRGGRRGLLAEVVDGGRRRSPGAGAGSRRPPRLPAGGVDDGEGEGGRHRGVDGVAARPSAPPSPPARRSRSATRPCRCGRGRGPSRPRRAARPRRARTERARRGPSGHRRAEATTRPARGFQSRRLCGLIRATEVPPCSRSSLLAAAAAAAARRGAPHAAARLLPHRRARPRSASPSTASSSRARGRATRPARSTTRTSASTSSRSSTAATNRVVYSRGFASIYGEWETTDEAKRDAPHLPRVAALPGAARARSRSS